MGEGNRRIVNELRSKIKHNPNIANITQRRQKYEGNERRWERQPDYTKKGDESDRQVVSQRNEPGQGGAKPVSVIAVMKTHSTSHSPQNEAERDENFNH